MLARFLYLCNQGRSSLLFRIIMLNVDWDMFQSFSGLFGASDTRLERLGGSQSKLHAPSRRRLFLVDKFDHQKTVPNNRDRGGLAREQLGDWLNNRQQGPLRHTGPCVRFGKKFLQTMQMESIRGAAQRNKREGEATGWQYLTRVANI